MTNQQTSDAPWKLPLPTHSITHTLILTDKLVFTNQVTYVGGGFFLDYQDVPPQGSCLQSRYTGSSDVDLVRRCARGDLRLEHAAADESHDRVPEPHAEQHLPDGPALVGSEDGRQLLPVERGGRRPRPEVRHGLAQGSRS